jgi:hypothetical protein
MSNITLFDPLGLLVALVQFRRLIQTIGGNMKIRSTVLKTVSVLSVVPMLSWASPIPRGMSHEQYYKTLVDRTIVAENDLKPLKGLDKKYQDFLNIFNPIFGAKGEKYQAELAGLKAVNASIVAESASASVKNLTQKNAIAALNSSLSPLQSQNNTQKTRMSQHEAKVSAVDGVVSSQAAKVSVIDGTLSRHVTKLNQVDTTAANHVTKIGTVDGTLSRHVTKLNTFDGTLSRHVTKLNEIDGTMSRLVTKSSEVDGALSRQVTKAGSVDSVLTGLVSRIARLEQVLNPTPVCKTYKIENLSQSFRTINIANNREENMRYIYRDGSGNLVYPNGTYFYFSTVNLSSGNKGFSIAYPNNLYFMTRNGGMNDGMVFWPSASGSVFADTLYVSDWATSSFTRSSVGQIQDKNGSFWVYRDRSTGFYQQYGSNTRSFNVDGINFTAQNSPSSREFVAKFSATFAGNKQVEVEYVIPDAIPAFGGDMTLNRLLYVKECGI